MSALTMIESILTAAISLVAAFLQANVGVIGGGGGLFIGLTGWRT